MPPISIAAFLAACKSIQTAKPVYKKGGDGSNGTCDCIGLIIGAVRRAGGAWKETHGSNYAARNEMRELVAISSVSQLQPGMAVYKRWMPGDAKYALPAGYKSGSDLGDYYHVGVVISVAPLQIMHCTSWTGGSGIKIDTSLGNWKWGGRLKKVSYDGQGGGEEIMETLWVGKVIGGGLNLRGAASEKAVRIIQIPSGQTVKVLDKDSPEGWVYVDHNGKQGYVMEKFLQNIEDEPDGSPQEGTDKVNLSLSRAAAQELLTALQGQIK